MHIYANIYVLYILFLSSSFFFFFFWKTKSGSCCMSSFNPTIVCSILSLTFTIYYKFFKNTFRMVYNISASLVIQLVKNPPAMRETWVWSLGWEDPQEKGKLPTAIFWPGEFLGLTIHGVAKSQTRLSDFHFQAPCCVSTLTPSSGWVPWMPLAQSIAWMPDAESLCPSPWLCGWVPFIHISTSSALPLLFSATCYCYFREDLGCHPLGRDSQDRILDPFIFENSFSRERGLGPKRAHYLERPHSRGGLMA